MHEPGPGSLVGLPGATVSAILCVPRTFQTVSAGDGSYSLLLPGLYLNQCATITLEASAEGHETLSQTIAVADLRAEPVRDLVLTCLPPVPSPTPTPTGGAVATATGTATRTPGPTPTPTTTIYPSPFVKIAPSCSQFDAPGDDDLNLNEEYVCFTNTCCGSAYMGGWQVKDEANHTYTFMGLTLAEGASARLHSGCGTNTAADVYWCSGSAIWDDDHDTVYLYSAGGGHLLDSYTY